MISFIMIYCLGFFKAAAGMACQVRSSGIVTRSTCGAVEELDKVKDQGLLLKKLLPKLLPVVI